MTDTQYRVLGDLVAGGSIARETISDAHWRWAVCRADGTTTAVLSATLEALWHREWLSWHQGRAFITDAGRAAYAQAQAQRAAQEATG